MATGNRKDKPQPPAGPRASGGPPGRGRACGRTGLPSRSERCSAEAARPPPRAGPSAPSPPARPPLPGEEEGEWSSRRRHRCRHGARPRGGRDQPPGRIRPSASPPATSTPSLAPSPARAAAREAAARKRGETGADAPARARRGAGGGGGETERGAVAPPPRATRPRLGLTGLPRS